MQSDQETMDALRCVVEDEETFKLVVDRVFADMDINQNMVLDTAEFANYIQRCCTSLGVREPPGAEQISHVFRHLDLDNDEQVSQDEMAVFLRHLFREQLKHCAEKLRKTAQQKAQMHERHKPGAGAKAKADSRT